MKFLYIPFAFAFVFCFQNCDSCNPTSTNCAITLQFEVPLYISPNDDTIKVGDTLWLSSTIPVEMEDMNSGKLVNVFNYDFNLRSTINRMDIEGGPDAEYDFDLINKIGEQIILPAGPYYTSLYAYENSEQEKKLEIGLVAKIPGLFQIVFTYLSDDLQDVALSGSDCIENIEDITNNMNDGADNHYYLLLDSPNPLNTPELGTPHSLDT
ncbi:MAG TPA: hypothetical protein ENJ95_11795 [Bacteroidetes bacterium]|nr:hypothetical protein [Bacteroidota bacterium]